MSTNRVVLAGSNMRPGAPLSALAEHHDAKGWQLVACQWHRDPATGRTATTPLRGLTGKRAPFLTGDAVVAKVRHLVLHAEGGPDCTGCNAKPAIRPPLTVVGFDIDHGYSGKSGGDTLVNAEMALGPLAGTFSLTARGPYQPSRRLWFRQPADLVLRDDFFREFGGCIEVIRTAHRYSWAWPAIHTKAGRVVGPVLWYDADHTVVPLPHVDDLPELPPAWVKRGYELMATALEPHWSGQPGQAQQITERHADAIITKLTTRFMGPPDLRGGDFRGVLFGLVAALTRRAVARGHGEQEVHDEIRELFAEHPWRGVPNDRDVLWIADGIAKGRAEPWEFVPDAFNADGTLTDEAVAVIWATYPEGCSAGDAEFRDDLLSAGRQIRQAAAAAEPVKTLIPARRGGTDAQLEEWLARNVSHHAPGRLTKRVEWMRAGDLNKHARELVKDSLAGHYPAKQAAIELHRAYKARGGTDPTAVSRLLSAALGTVLSKGAR